MQGKHTEKALRALLGEQHYGYFVDANEAAESVVSMIEENRARLPGLLSFAEHEKLDQLRSGADAALQALLAHINDDGALSISVARRLVELAREKAEEAFWVLHKKLKPDYEPNLVLTEPLVTSGPGLNEDYESFGCTVRRQV